MKKKKKQEVDDKDFYNFQKDFYQTLKKFIDKGDKIQHAQKARGAIAPTEVLLFLLFWTVMQAKFKDAELDFLSMMFDKIMLEDFMKNKMIELPDDMTVHFTKNKKETIH